MQSTDGSCHRSTALRPSRASCCPWPSIPRGPRPLTNPFNSEMVYHANHGPKIDCLYLPRLFGAVPVHAVLLTPRRAHERTNAGRYSQATKSPFQKAIARRLWFPRHLNIQPLDNFSKTTIPSMPNAVAHATASAPAAIIRLYPSRLTTPPTPMIPMSLTPGSVCD